MKYRLGTFFELAKEAARLVKEQTGADITVINPQFAAVDEVMLEDLKKDHSLAVTLEDGSLDGGFGQKVASYYGSSDMKVINKGLKKEFIDRCGAMHCLMNSD